MSRYWKRGSGERRFPWIGFVHKGHLREFGEREACTQFQYGPNFWSIWIDFPATAARRYASETLGEFSDANLRQYFNGLGDNFASKFGYKALALLYPHSKRRRSDMNEFERRLYGKNRSWEKSMSELSEVETHRFVVGMKQPNTGVYIGAEPSTEDLIALSKKGTLEAEIMKVTKALLSVYLFLTGFATPREVRERNTRNGHPLGRKVGHILSTTSIDQSASWAVDRAMKHERDEGRIPEDVSSRVVHYDIESRDKDGKVVRMIEGKGRKSHIPVVLTLGEYNEAKEKKQDYFLYVITDDHKGYAVQDPAKTCACEERLVKVYQVKDWKEMVRQFSV